MLLGLITIYLAYIAVKQTQIANNTNNRLLKIEEIERKAFLKLDLNKSKIEDIDDVTFITVCFENIIDNLIIVFNIKNSKKLLRKK